MLIPYQLFPADNGGIKFKLDSPVHTNESVKISLLAKECPHEDLIMITFGIYPHISIESSQGSSDVRVSLLSEPGSYEFILTWFNKKLCINNINEENSYSYKLLDIVEDKIIGFFKFYTTQSRNITVEKNIIPLRHLSYKHIEGGQLHWVSYNGDTDYLPQDALIGGFDDGETIYIARAKHHGSQCIGMYIPSKHCAFVPWGHLEHVKDNFEILCGYNAMWMKCINNYVPENVFVAGSSEINNEHLYVGRAMIGSSLIVGKVHMLYKTCFLPYKGVEKEVYMYEILVRGDVKENSLTKVPKCSLNPLMALQPCV